MTVLEVRAVSFTHGAGRARTLALAPTDLSIEAGRSLALTGRSGAGKSTLAEIVLGLRRPAAGSVRIQGAPWTDPRRSPPRDRRRLVQGIPQDASASFVPSRAVGAQIAAALRRLDVATGREAAARVVRAAEIAHLDPALLDRRPGELSGGQAQRAAIARAVALEPALIVADEPTSALDGHTSDAVAVAVLDLAATLGTALLIVTHDASLAARCDDRREIVAPRAAG